MLDWASEGFLPTGPGGFAPAGRCGDPSQHLGQGMWSDFQPVQVSVLQPAAAEIIQACKRFFFCIVLLLST